MTFGEARDAAEDWARTRAGANPQERIVLVWDPAARLRIVVHLQLAPRDTTDAARAALAADLTQEIGAFFSGDVIVRDGRAKPVFDAAWDAAAELVPSVQGVRIMDRRRSKDDWFEATKPPWGLSEGPPIITFASYKGGFGRSTALASTAVQFAIDELRVLVIDLDLEAPGLLALLPPQQVGGSNASSESVGLVDVLLGSVSVEDAIYPTSVDPGIDVLPAGTVDAAYLEKLSRIEYEALVNPAADDGGPLHAILKAVHDRGYDVILLDARAGLHDLTGAAVNGTPHLVVLFGRDTDESWAGVKLMIRQIGERRVNLSQGQQDLLLVFGKAPGGASTDKTFSEAMARFAEHAYDYFSEVYYAEGEDQDDTLIPVPPQTDPDAQHSPVGIRFSSEVFHGTGEALPDPELGYGDLYVRMRRRLGISSE